MPQPQLNPFKGDTVPVTYADEHLLKPKTAAQHGRRIDWCANNCRTLARFMAKLPDQRHEQSRFYCSPWRTAGIMGESEHPERHVCGTAHCALGWAVVAHLIDGLQYQFLRASEAQSLYHADVLPMINGQIGYTSWEAAGVGFFGREAWDVVFTSTVLDREDLVRELRNIARRYRRGRATA